MQPWSMDPKCRNRQIFKNIYAEEGFGFLNQPKIARWRDFNALRRAHVSFHVSRKVVTRYTEE